MRPIKLLTLTSSVYVVIFALLTFFSFALFFSFFKTGLTRSMDEALANRKTRILAEVKSDEELPDGPFNVTDFRLTPAAVFQPAKDVYGDTTMLQSGEEEAEYVPFRKLTTQAQVNGKTYRLEIVVPVIEREAITSSLVKTLIWVFVLTVVVFFLSTRYFSKKLWHSFYLTLNGLRLFDIDRRSVLAFSPSDITEFNELNDSVTELTDRARITFNNQKQFIENASHELQTPLAISQAKLEQLINDPGMTEDQARIVQSLVGATRRMARLNKTLLLMSKIENEQFPDTENVAISPLLTEALAIFEDQQEHLQLTVNCDIDQASMVKCNRTLVELLVTNLVKNAFVHNQLNGQVQITLRAQQLVIGNTSANPAIPAEHLFQRFYKNSDRAESWGLGLAIVHKISVLNQWAVAYAKTGDRHTFTVRFDR